MELTQVQQNLENKQRCFNIIVQHLRKQGEACVKGKVCLYRNARGQRCAIGALISDEYYSPNLEFSSVRSKKVFEAVNSSQNLNMQCYDKMHYFLNDLQFDLHDKLSDQPKERFLTLLEKAVKGLATKHNLQIPLP